MMHENTDLRNYFPVAKVRKIDCASYSKDPTAENAHCNPYYDSGSFNKIKTEPVVNTSSIMTYHNQRNVSEEDKAEKDSAVTYNLESQPERPTSTKIAAPSIEIAHCKTPDNAFRNNSVAIKVGDSIADAFLKMEQELCSVLSQMPILEPVTHVYNPVQYAYDPHCKFVKMYCTGTKKILFLGMNPGPYGMAQNGVPFGEINAVKNWLKISGTVQIPLHEHPKRPVLGFECKRSEVSGARFWKLFQVLCGTPERFFKHAFVYNICPLAFMSGSGKNVTPPELNKGTRQSMNTACDKALCDVVALLKVEVIIGIGKFAQKRALDALKKHGITGIQVHSIMHPSPINPASRKGWDIKVTKTLEEIGVLHLFTDKDSI